MNRPQISIRAELLLIIVIALLLLPMQWVVAWFGAVIFHEACHYAALRLCGNRVFEVKLSLSGALMVTESLSRGREFLCAVSGPVGGGLLLLLSKWFPRLAICGLFQSVYNLLPIFPLDGGRAMRCILKDTTCSFLEWSVLILIGIICVYAAIFLKLGMLPIIFAGILFFKSGKVKIPCKLPLMGLQ